MFQRTSFSGLILFHFKRKLLNEKCQLANLIWLVPGYCGVVVNMPARKVRDTPKIFIEIRICWYVSVTICYLGWLMVLCQGIAWLGTCYESICMLVYKVPKTIIPISKYGEVEVRVVLMWHFMDDFFIKYI